MKESPCGQEVPFGNPRFIGSLRLPEVISRLGTTFIGSRAERSPIWFVATLLKSNSTFRLTSTFCLVQAAYAMSDDSDRRHRLPSSHLGSDGPCVCQGRLGVPTAHLVRWAADWRTLFRGPGLSLRRVDSSGFEPEAPRLQSGCS